MASAQRNGIVATLRTRLSSILAIVGLLAVTGAPLAAGIPHESCAMRLHTCADVLALTDCCCGEHGDVFTQAATTTSSQTDTVQDLSHSMLASAVVFDVPAIRASSPGASGSPPLRIPPDLPIVFSDLRI